MTSADFMQPGKLVATVFAATAFIFNGCATKEALRSPTALKTPYVESQLWAVAPFANESGVSLVRTDRVADLFVEQAEQIDGIDIIPVNRVIRLMKQFQLKEITSSEDVVDLMDGLGVDALIVGTVTSYDPYPPPKFGAAVLMYRKGRVENVEKVETESEEVKFARSGSASTGKVMPLPVAQASGVFDAANHHTLELLNQYSTGRIQPGSAYGKKAFLVSMELYMEFAAYRLLHDLLAEEWANHRLVAVEENARER